MRRVCLNLLLAAASFGVALGLTECGLRLAGYEAVYEIYSRPSQFWQYDAVLGWSHEPGARGRFVGPRPWPIEFDTAIEINSLGLRGPELPPAAPRERRVLFLGDSMVAGFEVEQRDTFVARLEEELGARTGQPVRAINAGVRGYGSDQYLLYYQERGRALAPDAVVVFHSANDPLDNITLHETRRPFGKAALRPAPTGGLERVGVPVPHYAQCEEISLSAEFDVIRREGLAFRLVCEGQTLLLDHSALFTFLTLSIPWSADQLVRFYHLGNPHAALEQETAREWRLAHASRILRALAEEARGDGAAVLLTGARADLEQLDLPALRGAGAAVLDLGAVWDRPRDEVRWKRDSHFNPEGHRHVAEILAPWIEQALREAEARR